MAEPAGVVTTTLLAYSPAPCPALDAILADDEHSLPSSNGQPLPDGRVQQGPLDYSRAALRFHLRKESAHMAVEGDMFVYYVGRDERGRPRRGSVAPDVFVVVGVPDRPDRLSYVLWREPDADLRFVLEIASKSTRAQDHGSKRSVYASLGVREYFIYDPPGRRRTARILGLRLNDGRYMEMPAELLPNGMRGVRSDTVDLVAYVNDNGDLRWFDPVAGRDLENYVESSLRAIAAETQRDAVAAERDALRARLAEAEAELRRRTPQQDE
ncbi:MAG: Uma2 family endonuclease [Gammaproteobacteria bacterium]|nr:Uma2 family endonuclease [Gammaproteobacteria bacterium]